MPTLTRDIINAAIEGFEAQKRRINEQVADLRQMLNPGTGDGARQPAPPKRKRRLSAAGRKAIAEAARRRWAAVKAAKEPTAPASAARKRVGRKRRLV
jgi:hypothetical protein